MLQAPSHLSRVCGHGHIKKFWLMQTQKESQACESKNNVLFSSPSSSRHANRASMKGLDSPQWSSPSPVAPSSGYGDAGAATGKHSSFTCAESLSPPSHFCKASSPLSPYPTASSGGTEDTDAVEDSYVRPDAVDSSGRAPGLDAHPSTSSSRSCSLNVASELECKPYHEPALATSEADPVESLPSEGYHRDDDLLSTSMEDSPVSNADKGHPHHTQHVKGIRPALEGMSADTHTEVEACSSPARHLGTVCTGDKVKWGDGKVSPSHRRMVCSNVLEGVVEKGRHIEATIESRPCDSHCESSPQVTSVGQHPVLKACSLCGTTKTPMWRSGPQGPKSLCNACGIRFKKYRSFPGHSESSDLMVSPLEGSAASKSLARPLKRKQNSLLSTCEPSRPQKMGLKSAVADAVSRQQKKSKWHQLVVKRGQGEFKQELNRDSSSTWNVHTGPASLKKIYGCAPFQSKFKKLAPMDEHRTVSRVFAKDEEEAAVLLMHLSCGLVY